MWWLGISPAKAAAVVLLHIESSLSSLISEIHCSAQIELLTSAVFLQRSAEMHWQKMQKCRG